MIVLPNGFNVYPEDIENALRIAGIRDSVVLEARPGRIEALLLEATLLKQSKVQARARNLGVKLFWVQVQSASPTTGSLLSTS